MNKVADDTRDDEKTIIIDIHLTRGLVVLLTVLLLVVAVGGYLALNQQAVFASSEIEVAAPSVGASGLRQYYQTKTSFAGANASTACAAGYHMASLWEILDTSNLEYNATLGWTEDDIGQGPVTDYVAWVRTGYEANSTSTPGQANCLAWTSSDPGDYGTVVGLNEDWTALSDVFVWKASVISCEPGGVPVWCVED